MDSKFLDLMGNRRSIYALGDNVTATNEELISLIQAAVRQAPTSFNAQSTRAVILFGEAKDYFWNTIVTDRLKQEVPDEEAFKGTQAKMDSFAASKRTVLFFIDEAVIKFQQESFPIFADAFPGFAETEQGMAQLAVWTALAEHNIGGNLQHYNPIVDAAVTEHFELPAEWTLRAQLNFGSIEAPAGDKDFMDDDKRFKVFGN